MANHYVAALETVGQIETCLRDITDLENRLQQVPLWRPAAVMSKQAAESRRMIAALKGRLDGRLVVTLIGPSGAGKSTLFNALAGVDEMSPVGRQRPTTRDLVVLASDPRAVQQALGQVGDGQLTIQAGPAARDLDHLILVDTPDTDSTQNTDHIHRLNQVVAHSDVLICVFDAQNPKRRDHADFMAPLVRRFNGASLVAVVNKCDRQDDRELTETIGPDFQSYLKQAWPTQPEALLLISARRHLQNPQWDPQVTPRHDLDQFGQLRTLILETMNQPGVGRDLRVANAIQIRDYIMDQVVRATADKNRYLTQATAEMATAEAQALHGALGLLRADDRRQVLGVQVRLYQALAQRWLGPVGWLVAIWSRLIIFGSGLTALVRFGNPLRQIWGMLSSFRQFKESRTALKMLNDQERVDTALLGFRKILLTRWPDIAELLVKADFDPMVRELEALAPENDQVGRTLDSLWADTLDAQINSYAKGLSHILIQFIFNLPGVALMGYVGWLTASGFYSGQYLSSDFFLHALLTIAIVLLLSFFLLQAVVRLTIGKDRIQRRAFHAMEKTAAERPHVATRKIADQVARVMGLAENRSSESVFKSD